MHLPTGPLLSFSRRLLSRLSLLAALALPAAAHQMWIEPLPAAADSGKAQLSVRFGEFGDSVEKSPGFLDALAPVVAWLPADGADKEAAPLPVTKQSDHFLVPANGPDAFALTNFPVMSHDGGPGRLPFFYLRWHAEGPAKAAGVTTPAHTLDLVPEGGNAVRIYFRNAPVPDCPVKLMTAGGVETAMTTDKEGRVTLPATEPGLTLLTVNRREDLAGSFLGKPFAGTSHNASLSWVTPKP